MVTEVKLLEDINSELRRQLSNRNDWVKDLLDQMDNAHEAIEELRTELKKLKSAVTTP